MPAEFDIIYRDQRFRMAMRRAPGEMTRCMSDAMKVYLRKFQGKVSKERLRGRPGLKRRTAALVRSQDVVVRGNTLETLEGRYTIGGRSAPYARVHQYGTVGAGGTLPDITPKRGKFLVFQPSGSTSRAEVAAGGARLVAAGNSGVPLVFAKKVAIPPRLELFKLWKRDAQARLVALRAGVDKCLVRIAAQSRESA